LETLLLTDDEVNKLLSMDKVMEKVESAFREKGLGHVQMPAKLYLFYKKYNGDLRTMPSYLEELDGTTVTDLRTGASGGIAAKYLARKDSKVVGLVGAGAQAKTQLMALLEVYRKLEEVRVWSRSKETKQRFVAETKPAYGHLCKIALVESVEEAVEGADIVVTTTPSRRPLVMNNMVSSGMHFNCIGADAPGKQELDPAILKRAKIVVDDWEQASHSGEINVPLSKGIITKENVWADICEIAAGLKRGRESRDEITVFTSTGLAVQDAVTAKIAYSEAIERGVGRSVKIT